MERKDLTSGRMAVAAAVLVGLLLVIGMACKPAIVEFTSVSAGLLHTCGVGTDGSVECWGDDEHGQATPPDGKFASVSAGGSFHTCGVRGDGSVECWGLNREGQATPPGG